MKKLFKTLLGLFIIANTPTLADNIKYSGGIEIKVNGSTIFEKDSQEQESNASSADERDSSVQQVQNTNDADASSAGKQELGQNTNDADASPTGKQELGVPKGQKNKNPMKGDLNVFLEGRSEEYGIKLNLGIGGSILPKQKIGLEDINITGKISRYNLIKEGDELSFKLLGKEKKQLVLGLDLCKMIGNTDFSIALKIKEKSGVQNSSDSIYTPSFKFSKIRNSYLPKNGSITIGGGFSKTSSGHPIEENLNIAYNDIEDFPIKGFKGTYKHKHKYGREHKHEYLPDKTKWEGGITLDVKNKSFPWLENIDITLGHEKAIFPGEKVPLNDNNKVGFTIKERVINWYLGFVVPFKWQVAKNTNMSLTIKPTFKHQKNNRSEPTSFFASSNITMPIELKIEWNREWDQK